MGIVRPLALLTYSRSCSFLCAILCVACTGSPPVDAGPDAPDAITIDAVESEFALDVIDVREPLDGADAGLMNDTPQDIPLDTFRCPAGTFGCAVGGVVGCVNLQTNVNHCGACGAMCSVPNATAACTQGFCSVGLCVNGFGDCDRNSANGCETDIRDSVSHCGGCGTSCPVEPNGTQRCMQGVCSPQCSAGFDALGGRCVLAPRPVFPLSLGDVSLRRPTLRWDLPVGVDGAVVDLCRDRACTMILESRRVRGGSTRPTLALPARSVVFWRLRSTVGDATGLSYSPTWLFHVPATDNSGAIDTSTNPRVDLNGDGFDDVVVGSPGDANRRGRVRVFHGGNAGVSPLATRTLDGVALGDEFGNSVAGAGDVNGDGFGDLVVGAHVADPNGHVDFGAVYLFHGSPMGIGAVPVQVIEGPQFDDHFGVSVSGAGDLNGDGYAEVVVGAFQHSRFNGRDVGGTTSVFRGSSMGINSAPAQVLLGADIGEAFGFSVHGAGDVNGDGLSDVVVGSLYGRPGGLFNAGRFAVFHGSPMGPMSVPAVVVNGEHESDFLGVSVASAGDVNADGFSDIVVGVLEADPGGRMNAGSAALYHGGVMGISAAASTVLSGASAEERFGVSVAAAHDVNGDGFDDIVVGAYRATRAGRVETGIASVFHGGAMGIGTVPARSWDGVAAGDRFGAAVSSPGDMNGDGFADVVVSAPYASGTAGAASLYLGSLNGAAISATQLLSGANAREEFGASLASAMRSARRSRFWGRNVSLCHALKRSSFNQFDDSCG